MTHRRTFRTKLARRGRTLYAIRRKDGTFANIESLAKSARGDRRRRAKTIVPSGQGFRGDQKRYKRSRRKK